MIKAGALKLGLEPGDELYDADRLKKSTGLKIDLNVALNAANGTVATAIKAFAGTTSYYKTLSGYSDGTPTVISTTAEIDSAPFVPNYPDRNAYGIAHSTILGDVTH